MKIYFDSWWAQNHHNFQGITDEQAKQIWSTAQKAANNNQPCEWCNSTSAKIDSLENQLELAIQHVNDCDANAPWLTAAHTLCTDYLIEQGHISYRLNALRAKIEAAGERPAPCFKFCEATAFKIRIRQLEAELERTNKLLNRPIAGSKFVDLRQLSYSKAEV